jgi:hypothetical protein
MVVLLVEDLLRMLEAPLWAWLSLNGYSVVCLCSRETKLGTLFYRCFSDYILVSRRSMHRAPMNTTL